MCRRDFVLLVGNAVTLGDALTARLRAAGVVMISVPPVRFGRPTLDKLHAWNLTTYAKLLVIDSDAVALQSLDVVFALREGAMGHHPYEVFQGRCAIPAAARGQGGFFLIEPRASGYVEAVRHVDAHPEYWDMAATNHTPQQTGTACYFQTHTRSLHVLPCATWYDISVRYHVAGAQHHRQCVRWQPDPAVCNDIARRVEAQCVWALVSRDVRAVHLKGSTKPYRNILRQCKPLELGGIGVAAAATTAGSGGGGGGGGGPLAPLSPRDDLAMRRGAAGGKECYSRDTGRAVRWMATREPVHPRCCSFVNLIKAEWWRYHRLVRANAGQPSAGVFSGVVG